MFSEYNPSHLSSLARIHTEFAGDTLGILPISERYWEALFSRPEIDPRRDIIILGSESAADSPGVKGFCWIYTQPAPSHVYLRGPFVSPCASDAPEAVSALLNKAIERAVELDVGRIEGRVVHSEWSDVYKELGFKRAGAYERWKLFPLKGIVRGPETPSGGHIRDWKGINELSILMDLFTASFGDHWDYEPPVREDWSEILKSTVTGRNILRVAESDGKVIGFVFGQFMPELSQGAYDTSYLVSISVHPDYRGKGWGKTLLGDWLRVCYECGMRSIELDMDELNESAAGLYSGYGFRRVRTEGVWRKYLKNI